MPTFDIFSGAKGKDPVWVCAVEGLEEAKYLLQKIAAEKRGCYFLFSAQDNAVVAQIGAPGPQANKPQRAKTDAA